MVINLVVSMLNCELIEVVFLCCEMVIVFDIVV